MDNIFFTVTLQEVEGLQRGLPRDSQGRLIQGLQNAGLLIASFRDVDHKITDIRVFFIGWDTSDRAGAAKLVIAGSNQGLGPETTDMQLVEFLRSATIPQGSYYIPTLSPIENGLIEPSPDSSSTNYYFDLAFFDWESCNHMLTSNIFYFKDAQSERYYQQEAPSNSRLEIDPQARGIKFASALTTFKHGIIGMPNSTDPATFTTLIARPYPEPVFVDRNHPGAVAYDVMPTCPPYWKPGAQFIESMLFLSKSAKEAQDAAIRDTPGANSKSCFGLILLTIITILSVLLFLVTHK
jgi:hypothetical protein